MTTPISKQEQIAVMSAMRLQVAAERDAAAAKGVISSDTLAEARAEGERRATAAIVAWLFDRSALADKVDRDKWWTLREAAASIERGDHLTEAKPPQEGSEG